MALSAYKSVWLFALFDLPVATKENRRHYAQFRKKLLDKGFTMLQFSVYAKHHASEEAAESARNAVVSVLPPEGQVRILSVTDHQFGRMEVFTGRKRTKVEDPPMQITLF
ncbi:MAG: CRISPR-associated endonuclease Cas2 [Bryobacter sp.]|nr:CRISPR-associated endonuclease Cas2 [Bryobacter sp.]